MANGRFLLDTNIAILLLNRDQAIQENAKASNQVFIPIIALGELIFGAAKSSRMSENLGKIEILVATTAVATCDFEVAKVYGRLKNSLKLLGRPIPDNDLWIAAIAVRWQLTLISRDSHFQNVPDLLLSSW